MVLVKGKSMIIKGMKKNILSEISKENKINFLKSLQSGQFTLGNASEPQPGKSFKRIGDFYQCKETGERLSREQIEAMKGQYLITIELISNLSQHLKVTNLFHTQKKII
jgi:hypothetical protein